jgi:hypothetical protein
MPGQYQIVRAVYVPVVPGGVIPIPSTSLSLLLSESPLSTVYARRARVAALARFRDAVDPELTLARAQMGEEVFGAAVERALASAPPMRPEVRDRVIALLSTTAKEVVA